jgi:catechol 2,3-dioxygenase-like lactoylglutathione lyase family enzyme
MEVTMSASPEAGTIDMKLEVVTLPVSDPDRAKAFYQGLGWRLDADFTIGDAVRAIQLTPPRSACSIAFGKGLTTAEPGSVQRMELVVSDIEAAREELTARGAEVSEVFHLAGLDRVDPAARVSGPSPDRPSYGSFATFRDPDGNGWLLQQVTTRLPGRVDPGAFGFGSASDLASALRRAATAHGEHERRTGKADPEGWPDWYAAYLTAEQSGAELPT